MSKPTNSILRQKRANLLGTIYGIVILCGSTAILTQFLGIILLWILLGLWTLSGLLLIVYGIYSYGADKGEQAAKEDYEDFWHPVPATKGGWTSDT